jgi:NADH:ubiquinone reductase (non-electrogenic)
MIIYSNHNNDKKTICIIGLGWASTGFLKNIDTKKYNIHVISKNSNFLYTPLLAQNIKNNLNLELKIDDINNNINHTKDEVIDIDFKNNNIYTKNKNSKISYDYLIFSHGGETNTFNIQGVNENCYFLKSNEDANIIRKKLISLPKFSNIVVIGCGLTGSEVIGTLIDYSKFNIYAIDALLRPLNIFDKKLSNKATELWRKNNVNTFFGYTVSLIDKNTIQFKNNSKPIDYDLVLWCGGIKLSQFSIDMQKKLKLSCTK